ncbi:MAG: YDG domain-containing protein [Treponema sp.]|nr:YDG domain-containing protein [Treponema sp.]
MKKDKMQMRKEEREVGKRGKANSVLSGFFLFSLLFFLLYSCHNPFLPPKAEKIRSITAIAITVAEPTLGVQPASTIGGADHCTLTAISWTPDDNPFEGGTAYTVTVTLTAHKNYIFMQDISATCNDDAATVIASTETTVTLTYTFAATVAVNVINTIDITVAAPVKGAVPAASIGGAAHFTLTGISWTPDDNPFAGLTAYTVSITVTADDEYTFADMLTVKINNIAITNATVNAHRTTVTFSHTFPATLAKNLTGLSIAVPPQTTGYTHGDVLDLSDFAVTSTYENDPTDTEDILLDDFDAYGIYIELENGTLISGLTDYALRYAADNGKRIIVSYGILSAETDNDLFDETDVLAITQKALAITGATHTKVYDGSTSASGVTATLNGVVGSDTVTVTVSAAAYASANVGAKINITAATLGGADASNYTLTLPANGITAATGITPKALAGVSITLGGTPITGAVAVNEELTASYTGSETVSYQWKKGGANVTTGGTGMTYTPTEAGDYTVTVSLANHTSSTSAAVTVKDSAVATITFPDIADGAPELEGYADIEFSRGFVGLQEIELDDPGQYAEVHWYISGTSISQSYTAPISNGNFIFDPADFATYANGKYILTIDVQKADSQWYNTTIGIVLKN